MMTSTERDLLKWLAQENGQYGECYGKTLDALLERGLAEVLDGQKHQSGFIAKGNSKMYQAVAITDAGRTALASEAQP